MNKKKNDQTGTHATLSRMICSCDKYSCTAMF